MSKLATIHGQLGRLRRRRQGARWATGYSALVVAIVLVLAAMFLVDWTFEMTKLERAVAVVLGLVALAWAFRRYTRPWLGTRETEVDMALLVERQQKIDSDLVAALQFESPEAARWGSPQLESAVIDYVAEFGRGWNVLEGFDRSQVVRRLSAMVASLVLVAIVVILFPDHVRAFLNRLALGSAHYPTKTQIESVLINGQPIEVWDVQENDIVARCPYAQVLTLAVNAAGELPESGRVELNTLASGVRREIELARDGSGGSGAAVYQGELPQLVDSLTFQIYLGDAWTDPLQIEVIPLPAVMVTRTARPPSYALAPDAVAEPPVTSHQLAVLEGSDVDLELKCVNKRLTSAVLSLGDKEYPLTQEDDSGHAWRLTAADSPLKNITEQIRYQIQVTDEDGLKLQHPIQQYVRIKADRKPSISASLVTNYVLPTAAPTIRFRAMDDFGISKVTAHLEVIRQGTNGEAGESRSLEPIDVTKFPEPVLRHELAKKGDGRFKLSLAPFKLEKNDQVKVTLEVTDYRGDRPGKTESSEALVLNVTDRSGFLAAQYEQDEKSYRQTNAIIRRQTETGGRK